MDERRSSNPKPHEFQDSQLVRDMHDITNAWLYSLADIFRAGDFEFTEIPFKILLKEPPLIGYPTEIKYEISLGNSEQPEVCIPLATIIPRDRTWDSGKDSGEVRPTSTMDSDRGSAIISDRSREINFEEIDPIPPETYLEGPMFP